jgi:diguanylate cyclase (GGDEF)-like protein
MLLGVLAQAARAFDTWDHDRLRALIDALDAAGTASQRLQALLRAQLAARLDVWDDALSQLQRGQARPAPDGDALAQDPDALTLRQLLDTEAAVAAAYVWVNTEQVHGVGPHVERAWAAAQGAPPGLLGDRQRARAAFLFGVWCNQSGEQSLALLWIDRAREIAERAGLEEVAAQCDEGLVSCGLTLYDDACAAGEGDQAAAIDALARVRQVLDAGTERLARAPEYLRISAALRQAQVAMHDRRLDDARALCDTVMASDLTSDLTVEALSNRARVRRAAGDLDGALADVERGLAAAQAFQLGKREASLCELGADLAGAAGQPTLEVMRLRRHRHLRARMHLDDARRRAHLAAVALVTERARREAADAAAHQSRLQLENDALTHRAGQLAHAALTDPLTGLPNRRSFDARLAELCAAPDAGPIGLALVDVDHFKRVNDGYGHAAGDAVLMRLAVVLGHSVRQGDVVARIGGEEFAAVFVGAAPAAARDACERIRQAVQDQPWSDLLPGGTVTVSIGLAPVPCGPDGPAAAIAQADRHLYDAKRAGRNRVHDSATRQGQS